MGWQSVPFAWRVISTRGEVTTLEFYITGMRVKVENGPSPWLIHRACSQSGVSIRTQGGGPEHAKHFK